jgi:hypothetical protein
MSERPSDREAGRTRRKERLVSIGATPATTIERGASTEFAVEVEVEGRWDALALSEALVPFHSFLVQKTAERWVVHARAPGWHGETLADALLAVEDWRADRRTSASVRLTGRTDQITR